MPTSIQGKMLNGLSEIAFRRPRKLAHYCQPSPSRARSHP